MWRTKFFFLQYRADVGGWKRWRFRTMTEAVGLLAFISEISPATIRAAVFLVNEHQRIFVLRRHQSRDDTQTVLIRHRYGLSFLRNFQKIRIDFLETMPCCTSFRIFSNRAISLLSLGIVDTVIHDYEPVFLAEKSSIQECPVFRMVTQKGRLGLS